MQKQQRAPFGLRMPEELQTWIKEEAARAGRSMNNLIVHLLQQQKDQTEK